MDSESLLKNFDTLNQRSPALATAKLFGWISNDKLRATLYQELLKERRVLSFFSRADTKDDNDPNVDSKYSQTAYLLTAREHVKLAMEGSISGFSNHPFQALGSSLFMLGLDDGDLHKTQREFAKSFLRIRSEHIYALCSLAFKSAAVLPLKSREFDLADFAEQIAIRFVGFLFGFSRADHGMLGRSLKAVSHAIHYQVHARHFVTDPGAIPNNSQAMAGITKRVAELIDLYREAIDKDQEEALAALNGELSDLCNYEARQGRFPLRDYVPILRRVAEHEDPERNAYSSTELAIIVTGLISGTVSNVKNAISIAASQILSLDRRDWEVAYDAAAAAWRASGNNAGSDDEFLPYVAESLRLNPPVAFLPRKSTQQIELKTGSGIFVIPKGASIILCIGGATRDNSALEFPHTYMPRAAAIDPLIFGGIPDDPRSFHQCIGQYLAIPLISYSVRQIMLLPGVCESLDPSDGEPIGLKKKWGTMCDRYPLEFNRTEIIKQTPLMVVMDVKKPISVHAERLKEVIAHGAPLIEKRLRDSKHVHFAAFKFLEGDSKLALFTVYDRDFDAYIEHFALQIGDLFDRVFEHIEDSPPLPVDKFPKEFVETIRRFNSAPVGGYFFSAYPLAEVAMIQHQMTREDH